MLKTFNLIKIGVLRVWKNLWGYGRKVHAKFWPWGNPWNPSYDHFCVSVGPRFSVIEYFDVYGGIFKHIKLFGDMVGRCMPNSGHGGPPGTGVMTIFMFYVSVQIPNIEYFEVYGGLQALGGISSFFS